jgi:hypothetical protein
VGGTLLPLNPRRDADFTVVAIIRIVHFDPGINLPVKNALIAEMPW